MLKGFPFFLGLTFQLCGLFGRDNLGEEREPKRFDPLCVLSENERTRMLGGLDANSMGEEGCCSLSLRIHRRSIPVYHTTPLFPPTLLVRGMGRGD